MMRWRVEDCKPEWVGKLSANLDTQKKERKKPTHYEYNEQVEVFKWAHKNMFIYPDLFWLNSSQAGQKFTSKLAGGRAKAAGMKKGYPDIFLPVAKNGYHGLYIEMKYGKNEPTSEQEIWLIGLEKNGYNTNVCYSSTEATNVILEYLNEK